MRQVSIHRVPVAIIPHPTSFTLKRNEGKAFHSEQPCLPPPPILFSAIRRKAGWIMRCPLNGWIMSVLKYMPDKKEPLVLGGHRSHTQPCCNWNFMNIWTVLLLLPLTALIKCSLLMQQSSDPLTHNIHWFFYHSKIDSTPWTVTDERTDHIIDGYEIPKGCKTETVMNRLKKSVL